MKVIVSSKEAKWLESKSPEESQESARDSASVVIDVDPGQRYQDILGFGAALTDSACYVINGMEEGERQKLLADFFSPEAMNLNVMRVSVGASDYARETYSYNDTPGDESMSHFSIDYDRPYIIPTIRKALELNPDMYLFASAWSPPGWMKTTGTMRGGWMRDRYLPAFARYYAAFLEAYEKEGIRVQALTPQNEVETDQGGGMPACYWHPEQEMAFARDHLGPLLREKGMDTKIWLLDHNYDLWHRAKWMLDDAAVKQEVAGIAFHPYGGKPEMMSLLHDAHPEVDLYWTEGGPNLHISPEDYSGCWGEWGQTFTGAFRNWCRSVTAWNLALDEEGKPNIGHFHCGGLVTVHSETKAVSYSGQYWAIGHFSRYVRRGACRIGSESASERVLHVAFENSDGETVVVLTNRGDACQAQVRIGSRSWTVALPADSIATLIA